MIIFYKIGPVRQEEKIFKFRECIFCNFIIISLRKKAFPFDQLKSTSPREKALIVFQNLCLILLQKDHAIKYDQIKSNQNPGMLFTKCS